MNEMNIDLIRIDGGTQSRVTVDPKVVADYAEHIQTGSVFPPVRVYFDGVNYWLADGFHRYFAHKKANKDGIAADVVNGTQRDAKLHSLSANAFHGLQRTNADKRKAVVTMLEDFEWQEWMNTEIARHCHVSPAYVGQIKKELGMEKSDEPKKYRTADGKVHEKRAPKGKEPKAPELKEPPKEEPKQHDEHQEMIDTLITENEKLLDKLALKAMEATPEEKELAKQTIDELREDLRLARIEIVALKKSRDQFQNENNQLKKQVAMLTKKLKGYEQ